MKRKPLLTKQAKKNIIRTISAIIIVDVIFLIFKYFYGEITKDYIERRVTYFFIALLVVPFVNFLAEPKDK